MSGSTYWSPRWSYLIDAWQDMWHPAVQGIVGDASPNCQESIATEYTLCEDTLEGCACDAFLLKLTEHSVDGVSQKGTSALDEPGMLVFCTGVQLDAHAVEVGSGGF